MTQDSKRHFKLLVVANNIQWPSLKQQLQAITDFYSSVCVIEPTIIYTNYSPTYKRLDIQNGLSVVDPAWYETNITIPYAADYDLNLLITPMPKSPVTYGGYMNPVNIGPWETTVFVNGENDHVYMGARDMGLQLVLNATHELSHAFYYMLGKADLTHTYFPVAQNPYTTDPNMVLADFDFESTRGILAWCRERLLSAMLALNFIKKKRLSPALDV